VQEIIDKAKRKKFDTRKRADGTMEVTYKGAIYRHSKDAATSEGGHRG